MHAIVLLGPARTKVLASSVYTAFFWDGEVVDVDGTHLNTHFSKRCKTPSVFDLAKIACLFGVGAVEKRVKDTNHDLPDRTMSLTERMQSREEVQRPAKTGHVS